MIAATSHRSERATTDKHSSRRLIKRRLRSYTTHSVLVLLAAVMLMPFGWMVLTSFKPANDVFASPPVFISENASFDAYRDVLDDGLLRNIVNTAVYASGSTVLRLFVSAMAGFAFAKYRFKGRDWIFGYVISTMVIPFTVLMVPTFILLRQLNLLNTQVGLIVPTAASAFGVFFMRQYMMAVPDEIIDAARIDGASEWRIFRSIVIPVIKPGMIALGLVFFMQSWNDYVWPLIVLREQASFTLPLAIRGMVAPGLGRPIYQNQMAGSVISIIPLLILFLVFQRRVVEGIAGGAVK